MVLLLKRLRLVFYAIAWVRVNPPHMGHRDTKVDHDSRHLKSQARVVGLFDSLAHVLLRPYGGHDGGGDDGGPNDGDGNGVP